MKRLLSITLLLNLAAAGLHAQQIPVKSTVSGTAAPSTVNLQTGTDVSEYDLAGSGTLGQFTLRMVSAGAASPGQSNTCSGLYIPVIAGEAVFRTRDGSLLKGNLTGGSDCIDFVAGQALCIRTFQVIGGTGRFSDATGEVTVTMTVAPVVPGQFSFFTVTGEVTGNLSGIGGDEAHENAHE